MKNFKVVVPDLDDFVVDEFDTMEEVETFLNECVEYDKKNPQGYVPYYVIRGWENGCVSKGFCNLFRNADNCYTNFGVYKGI